MVDSWVPSVSLNHMVESSTYSLDLIFQALADPTRRRILGRVCRRPLTVNDIAKPFAMSLAAVSKHLKILDRARLIGREKRGSFSYVSLNPEALKNADQWIAAYEVFWNDKLETLKHMLETEET